MLLSSGFQIFFNVEFGQNQRLLSACVASPIHYYNYGDVIVRNYRHEGKAKGEKWSDFIRPPWLKAFEKAKECSRI